jgi:hypothetical protein
MNYGTLRIYRMLETNPCYTGSFADEMSAMNFVWSNYSFEMERGWVYAEFIPAFEIAK